MPIAREFKPGRSGRLALIALKVIGVNATSLHRVRPYEHTVLVTLASGRVVCTLGICP
jgi:hypothetical protein